MDYAGIAEPINRFRLIGWFVFCWIPVLTAYVSA